MASQLDLDQGGTYREWDKFNMGPTIGWVWGPTRNELPISAVGTYTLDLSTNFVIVDLSAGPGGAVTIILPSTLQPTGRGASNARPGLQLKRAITVVDGGGTAGSTAITIQPSVGDTILGLTQIQITVNYGGYTLAPYPGGTTWLSISP